MAPEIDQTEFTTIEIPRVRRSPWGFLKIIAAVLVVGGAAWAWQAGYRPPLLLASSKAAVELVEIDRGDVDVYVVENGSIESANNTTVRCQVEALIGLIGGTQGTTAGKGQTTGSGSGQGSGGSSTYGSGAQGGSGGAGGSGSGTDASGAQAKTKSKT